MVNVPENLRYSRDHEWAAIDGEIATIGITDYAQNALGDIVYVDFPKVGDTFNAHEAFGAVDSVKTSSEIFTPLAGEVVEIHDELNETTELVNTDPYGEGWMIKIKISNTGEADKLLNAAEYEEHISGKE